MTSTHPDLLAGLARCGVTACACAAPLAVATSDASRLYACPHGHLRVNGDDLEETVAVLALARLATPDVRARLEHGVVGVDASPEGLATWWADADPAQRRSLLDLVVERVTVQNDQPRDPGALAITWR